MNDAPTELREAMKGAHTPFGVYHQPWMAAKFWSDWDEFARARMDLPRTNRSREIALGLLQILGYADLGEFRDVVLKREESRVVSYDGQRDHSAHTVNNYLLGWYFWQGSRELQTVLGRAIEKRRRGRRPKTFPFDTTNNLFGAVWQYVSLLHDIGYIFEGAIHDSEVSEQSELVRIGVHSVRGYFESRMWHCYDFGGGERDRFIREIGEALSPPSFTSDMMIGELADALRDPGDLGHLRAAVPRRCAPEKELPCDTFKVWKCHYDQFDLPQMASRIESLGRVFVALTTIGHPRSKVRILDHGVCSGLLQFLVATYYYRLQAAARRVHRPSPLVKRFLENDWDPEFWWSGIAWATAACAVHNIQGMDDVDKLDDKWPRKLALEDDPLAYLGVLVDILQEWDRYPVRPSRRGEPVQGHEVKLGIEKGIVQLRFEGASKVKRATKVSDELERSLADWKALVAVST